MKKITLLVAFALFSALGYAQVSYNYGWEPTGMGGWVNEGAGTAYARTTTAPCTGNGAIKSNTYYNVTSILRSPSLGTSNGGQVTFGYSYKALEYNSTTVGTPQSEVKLLVQWGNSATGPWTTAQTIENTTHTVSTDCSVQSVTFSAPPGALFVRFVATAVGGDSDIDYYFDDIVVSQGAPPTCVQPTALAAPAVTKNQVSLIWVAPATAPSGGYEVYYSQTNDAPTTVSAPNGGTSTTPAKTVMGLTPSTVYYAWVRSNCGTVNGTSVWAGPVQFTTMCDYPAVSGTTPGVLCGQGSAQLSATASAGSLYWFTEQTGGTYLGSGLSITSPAVTATTNFYVSAGLSYNDDVAIGTGTTTGGGGGNSPYYHGYGGNKTQYIIRAAELHAAGLAPGPINSLIYTITTLGTPVFNDFAVSIGATTQNVATATHIAGLTPVYSNPAQTLTLGDNSYDFDTPFVWDGTSNIVVQTCYSNVNGGNTSSQVSYYNPGYAAGTYTYADNKSAALICAATTGQVDGNGGTGTITTRPVIKFNANKLCASPREAVAVNVTTAPEITAQSSITTLCAGESATLSVTSANTNYTYLWTPGNTTGLSYTVTPTASTTYTVTATDSGSGCVTTKQVAVAVNGLPGAINLTPASAAVCNVQMLTVTGATAAGDAVLGAGTTAPGATAHPNPFNAWFGGSKVQMLYTVAELQAQGLVAGSSITSIKFDFAASVAQAANDLKIRIGTTANTNTTGGFVPLSSLTTVYSGTYTPVAGFTGLRTFTFTTPYIWMGGNIIIEVVHNKGDTGSGSGTRTKSTTTSFNSVYYLAKDSVLPAGAASFDALEPATWTTGGTTNFGTSMDRPNVIFAYSLSNAIAWTPSANLFTDAAATVPYTGQTNLAVVYAKPTAATTYTATATNLAGCHVTDTADLTVAPANTPTGATSQTIYANSAADATIEDIVVTETGVIWYASQANAIAAVSPLAAGTQVTAGSVYYGTLPAGSCAPLAVTISQVLGNKGFDIASFNYYPNPVQDVLTLSSATAITSVAVYNLLGQKVMVKEMNAPEAKIDMSQLAEGTYIVNITAGESMKAIKVVKKQ